VLKLILNLVCLQKLFYILNHFKLSLISYKSCFRIDEVTETTVQPRRRTTVAEPTEKTVLKVTNRNLIQSNIQENIQIKDTEKQGNSNSLDDDDSNLIAVPTEPVTENVPFPENIYTTATPVTTPPSAQVTKRLIRTESLNDAFDNDSNDVEETTLINGLSKQNDESLNSIAPRPFSRPSVTRTRAPISSSVNTRQTTTSGTTRRRPSQFRSTTETNSVDNEVEETTSRPLYSYPPGYRGTARFRATSSKSGQYDRDEDGLILGNYRPYDDNRLRSLNLNQRSEYESTERTVQETTERTRLSISRTQPSTTRSQASSTRRQVSTTRTQPFTTRSASKSRLFGSTTEASENEDEITTEQGKDVEAKYRFNLSQGNRPDKIRFELAVGRKIDFGYTPAANKLNKSSDPSKVTVITGPLNKSPLSNRDYTKGNVEEIPLVVTEAVTVSSFSSKLNLDQIPLNKSDIESFVRDEDLRTDLPIDETTTPKLRLKPSKIGFFKKPQGEKSEETGDLTTTEATAEENSSSRSPLRPTSTGFVQKNQNKSIESEVKIEDESSTSRFKLRAGQTRFPARSTVDTSEASEAPESLTSSRARPFAFQNRFTQKTNETALENTNDLDSTTTRTRPSTSSSSFRGRQSRLNTSTKAPQNSQALEDDDEESLLDTTTGRTRPSAFQNRFTRPRPSTKATDDSNNDDDDENSGESSIDTTTGKTKLQSAFQNRFSRPKQSDSSTSNESTTTVKSRLQSNFQNRFTRPKTTSSKADSNSEESSIDATTGKTRLQSALQNRFTRPKTTTTQSDDASSEESSIDSTTGRIRPAAFQSRLSRPRLSTQTADDSNTEESTTSRLRVRPSPTRFGQRAKTDVKIEDVNDLATESSLDQVEITKSRYQPKEKNQLAIRPNNDLEALDSVTERNIEDEENENEIDFTTVSSFESNILSNDDDDEENEEDNEISETTIEPLIDTTSTTRKTVVIRKRPVKKIDLVATRQTITEATEEVTENEDEEDEVKSSTETATSPLIVSKTASTRTRPTRRLVNIRKLATDDQASSVAQPNPTRKRIVFTRRKPAPVVDESPEDEIQISESPEKPVTNENAEESSEKPIENVTRRRVKVFRTRATTTEKAVDDEATTKKRISSTRTRIYKRPIKTADQEIESEVTPEEDKETSAAPRARFGPRKIVKVNKKLVEESSSSVQSEIENTSSSQGPKFSRPVYKILRTKTPKFLVDRPLTDDSSLIKTDDENQEIENEQEVSEEPENIQETEDEETQDELSEEPESSARPLLKYPTRPNSANRVVTIKRRPAFSLNARSTTIHPASTSRFSKESVPTRAKQVTIRRKYKPTSSSADSTVEVDEIEPEKRLKLEAKKKALFAKGYRKSLSTTLAPNITPLTDTETPENDDVVDTTEIPLETNDENILQSTPTKPRFSLSRFTTTTTTRPTTLHHVFAIDVDETGEKINKTIIKENNADEVIKKLQKLIEINRIVEVYSKEERGKLLKNKKWKSVKISELTVEKPPSNSKFGEISRETIIKLVKINTTTTTERPVYNHTREPKNVAFAETVFGQLESSTISLEGLFDREKKSNEDFPEDTKVSQTADVLRAPAPLLRPESNETNPIIISLKSLDQVILSKVQRLDNERENETTENPSEDTTLVDDN
jgi:hypothetical protein